MKRLIQWLISLLQNSKPKKQGDDLPPEEPENPPGKPPK